MAYWQYFVVSSKNEQQNEVFLDNFRIFDEGPESDEFIRLWCILRQSEEKIYFLCGFCSLREPKKKITLEVLEKILSGPDQYFSLVDLAKWVPKTKEECYPQTNKIRPIQWDETNKTALKPRTLRSFNGYLFRFAHFVDIINEPVNIYGISCSEISSTMKGFWRAEKTMKIKEPINMLSDSYLEDRIDVLQQNVEQIQQQNEQIVEMLYSIKSSQINSTPKTKEQEIKQSKNDENKEFKPIQNESQKALENLQNKGHDKTSEIKRLPPAEMTLEIPLEDNLNTKKTILEPVEKTIEENLNTEEISEIPLLKPAQVTSEDMLNMKKDYLNFNRYVGPKINIFFEQFLPGSLKLPFERKTKFRITYNSIRQKPWWLQIKKEVEAEIAKTKE